MTSSFFKKYRNAGIIMFVILFHLFMNYEVLKKSEVCRPADDGGRISATLRYYHMIFEQSSGPVTIRETISNILTLIGAAHPPLFEVVGACVWKLLVGFNAGPDENVLVLTINAIFLTILLTNVYGIGSILYSKSAGLLATILLSFFPTVFGHSRLMMLDLPLASLVTLSVFLLLKTNQFQSRQYSLLLGLVLGLSQLTKEVSFLFILAPLFYCFCKSYCAGHEKRTVLFNFNFALLTGIAVAGIVFLQPQNLSHAFHTYPAKAFFINQGRRPLDEFLYYFDFATFYPGMYLGIALIPMIVGYFIKLRSKNKILFLWFFVPFTIFTLFPNKAHRFLIPVLPPFALMASQGLLGLKLNSVIRKFYASFLLLLAVSQYVVYFFDFRPLNSYPLHQPPYNFDDHGLLTHVKDPYYPVVSALVEVFEKERQLVGTDPTTHQNVLFLFAIAEIHSTLSYKCILKNLPFLPNVPQTADPVDAPEPGTIDWSTSVLNADYVVDKNRYETSYLGEYLGGGKENVEDQLRKGFEKHRDHFTKIAELQIFDGSHLFIYKKIRNNI